MTDPATARIVFKRRGVSKGRPFLVLAALLTFNLSTAAPNAPDLSLYAFEEPHMGTLFKIKLYAPTEEKARRAATAAYDRIEELDQVLSDYIPGSELNRLEASPPHQPVSISHDLQRVLGNALRLARSSQGAFDPTVGHYTNLWRRALRKGILPTREQLEDVRARSGHSHLRLSGTDDGGTAATLLVDGLVLDLGGIAKGFAADEALLACKKRGLPRAAIAAGGDIRVGDPPPGEKAWPVPVLAPGRDHEEQLLTLDLVNAAVSSSGDREQFVEIDGRSYSHIVDPRTGLGLTRRISATVIAKRGMISDSHATALCVLGPEEGIPFAEKSPGIEALIVTTDAEGEEKRFSTTGFPAANQQSNQ